MGLGPREDAGLGLRGVGRAGGRHGGGGAGGRHGGGGASGRAMVAPADGVGVAMPADGVTVGGPAGGVAASGVSETRERRPRRGAFSMTGKSHTGSRKMETMERGRGKTSWGNKRTRCRMRSRRQKRHTDYIHGLCVLQETRARTRGCRPGLTLPVPAHNPCPSSRGITRCRDHRLSLGSGSGRDNAGRPAPLCRRTPPLLLLPASSGRDLGAYGAIPS